MSEEDTEETKSLTTQCKHVRTRCLTKGEATSFSIHMADVLKTSVCVGKLGSKTDSNLSLQIETQVPG